MNRFAVALVIGLLLTTCAPKHTAVTVNTVIHRMTYTYYCSSQTDCVVVAYTGADIAEIKKEVGCGICALEQAGTLYRITIYERAKKH